MAALLVILFAIHAMVFIYLFWLKKEKKFLWYIGIFLLLTSAYSLVALEITINILGLIRLRDLFRVTALMLTLCSISRTIKAHFDKSKAQS